MFQNTVKPRDVWANKPTVEIRNLLNNNDSVYWERFIHYSFLSVWHSFLTLDVLEHSIETLHAYKKDIQFFQGVSLIFFLYFCSSIPAPPPFSLLPSYVEWPYWHNQCFWCSALLVSIVLPYNYRDSFQSTQSYNLQCQTHQIFQTLTNSYLFFPVL